MDSDSILAARGRATATANTSIDDEGSFLETLKKMRERRISACQRHTALSQSNHNSCSSLDESISLRTCTEASSLIGTRSSTISNGGFLESLFEDSSSSVLMSPEQEQAAYWRRLSYQKRRHQHDPDSWEQGIGVPSSLSSPTPNSVMVDVKDIIEREFFSKLQDGFTLATQQAPPILPPPLQSQPQSQHYRRQSSRVLSSVDFGPHEEQARKLEYTSDDLHRFLSVDSEFSRLKKSLRHEGAITNGFLKQKLPLVIKQSQERLQRKRQEAQGLQAGS